jgi:hypothetical protein
MARFVHPTRTKRSMKMRKKIFIYMSIISTLWFFPAQADDSTEVKIKLPEGITLRPHMYGHFLTGQIVRGSLKKDDVDFLGYPQDQYTIDHVWHENAIFELGIDAIYHQRLKLAASLGTKLYFSYPILKTAMYTKNLRQDVYLDELYSQYYTGDATMPFFLGEVGFFKYKYNPDARNFGEYLFRTGTYPIWFDMEFDKAWQRLLGVHAQTNLFKSLKVDLLLASSTVAPAMDWSLAGLVNYDVAALKFISIGAGVDFANVLSVYNKNSFPKFGGDPTMPSTPELGMRYLTNRRITVGSTGLPDTTYDSLYYTFEGTKLMGRISIDPKVFLPKEFEVFGQRLSFGESDLRLYAEADLIGLKDYPDTGITQGNQKQLVAPSYDTWYDKMPVAIGFNFPVFNSLDVLNVEVEYFSARYYNDASNVINRGMTPLPYNVQYWQTPGNPNKSFIKWSLFAKKSFFHGHFAITGQIGRDHLRLPCAAYDNELWNELLVEDKDIAWYLKTSWMF